MRTGKREEGNDVCVKVIAVEGHERQDAERRACTRPA